MCEGRVTWSEGNKSLKSYGCILPEGHKGLHKAFSNDGGEITWMISWTTGMVLREEVPGQAPGGADRVEPRADNPTNLEKLVGELAEGLALTKRDVASLVREVAVLGRIPMGVPVSRVNTQERVINDMLDRLMKLEDEAVKLRQGGVYREQDSVGHRALISALESKVEGNAKMIGDLAAETAEIYSDHGKRLDALSVDTRELSVIGSNHRGRIERLEDKTKMNIVDPAQLGLSDWVVEVNKRLDALTVDMREFAAYRQFADRMRSDINELVNRMDDLNLRVQRGERRLQVMHNFAIEIETAADGAVDNDNNANT